MVPQERSGGGNIHRSSDSGDDDAFVANLFHEWTAGLSPPAQRIAIFSRIRDIPYAIVPQWHDSGDVLRLMITRNRGWCGPKHLLLLRMFHQLGLRVRFVTIPFRWQDQPVSYPPGLREMTRFLPPSTHLCCSVNIAGTWRILDATWDIPLKNAGFPVNEDWDGFSDTLPAVMERDRNGASRDEPGYQSLQLNPRLNFTDSLNAWLDEVRKPGYSPVNPAVQGR